MYALGDLQSGMLIKGAMTLSITTFSIMTLITDCCYAECRKQIYYAECRYAVSLCWSLIKLFGKMALDTMASGQSGIAPQKVGQYKMK